MDDVGSDSSVVHRPSKQVEMTDGFAPDLPSFEARPLPRFAFTNARRAEAYLRKKAIAVLEEASREPTTLAGWWAKLAADSLVNGYNLKWKMNAKRDQAKIRNFALNYMRKP